MFDLTDSAVDKMKGVKVDINLAKKAKPNFKKMKEPKEIGEQM